MMTMNARELLERIVAHTAPVVEPPEPGVEPEIAPKPSRPEPNQPPGRPSPWRRKEIKPGEEPRPKAKKEV